jgi:hypothetical protein
MLDAFIIEELRRREEAEKRKAERPRLELPNPADYAYNEPNSKPRDEVDEDEPKGERGVIIIEY